VAPQAPQPELEIGRLIDDRPMTGMQVLVAVLCGLALFLDGYDIQVMALVVPSLSAEWARPPTDFGLALSGALIGLSVGAAALAHLGDRYGRRTAVVVALALVGISTICTAFARSPEQFVLWRILTGMGLGVSIANCNAWTSEYMPLRRRAFALVSMNAAIGLGAFSAGMFATPLMTAMGWRGLFMAGAVAPLLLAAVLMLAAPESLKFLMLKRPQSPRIPRILTRLAPDIDPATIHIAPPGGAIRGSPLELLGPVLRGRTLLLWSMVAMNVFTLYVLISWLPTLLQSAGWPLERALQGAVIIQLGGVAGGIGLSFLLDRGLSKPSLIGAWLATAAALLLFLFTPSTLLAWGGLLLVIGAGVSGAALCLNALSVIYYPSTIRATGGAWAGVLSGAGSITAPLAGAWIIRQGLAPVQVLTLLTVPVLLCALGACLMRRSWEDN
jgi:AAHS family 4-hydroxybenzoate transporter-like MFS transporter